MQQSQTVIPTHTDQKNIGLQMNSGLHIKLFLELLVDNVPLNVVVVWRSCFHAQGQK